MSGHNKWSQIKHKKEIKDSRKGKLFSRLANQIALASRDGGGNPADNPNLRLLIETARKAEMPKVNIDRAIARGTGKGEKGPLKQIIYEAYGPAGVGILITTITDNPNRTISDVKATLSRKGGKLTELGAVSYLFKTLGEIIINKNNAQDFQQVQLDAIEAGALDVVESADKIQIYTTSSDLTNVRKTLAKYPIALANLKMVPKTSISLDEKARDKLTQLIQALEELDDVVEVSSNAEAG